VTSTLAHPGHRASAPQSNQNKKKPLPNKQPNYLRCFVCGIDNPIGLHLKFYTDDEGRCIAHFRPKPEY
jgi:hypothetical protein